MNLMLESDESEECIIICNTLNGRRLAVNAESLKILEVFRSIKSTRDAAEELKVADEDHYEDFLSVLTMFIDASFLVSENHGHTDEQKDMADAIFICARTSFIHCGKVEYDCLESGTIAIAGVGIDQATTGNPGARHGADRLREVSTRFLAYERDIFTRKNRGWYNSDLGICTLKSVPFADVGNIAYRTGELLSDVYDRCYRGALMLHKQQALPVFIGGDHSITAPLVRACCDVHGDIVLIHFDAHTDMGEWKMGSGHHHGNVMRRVLYENPNIELRQFGVRGFAGSPIKEERCYTITQATIEESLQEILVQHLPVGKKCYISLDVDVLDPSVAPGTGTPVPLGMTGQTLLKLLRRVAENNQVVGIDVVELSPILDRDDMTTGLIFHILMQLLEWSTVQR